MRARFLSLLIGAALAATAAGCNDATLPWQLDHDRIVAVRVTPPHIPPGGRASLDVLVTRTDGGPAVTVPMVAAGVEEETGLSVTVEREDDGWGVVAPDASAVEEARAALDLAPGEPVPARVTVVVELGDATLGALKTVYVGDERANPELGEVTVGGQPAADDLVIPLGADVALRTTAADTDEVDWFSSVGELSDVDDLEASLRADEPEGGHLALVIRDDSGGVAWGFWSLRAAE